MNLPIFIGGMYKSGTSLLRAMLGRHSRLFAGLETQWLHEDWAGDAAQGRRVWLERLAVFFDSSREELEAACGEAADVETCLDRMMRFLAARAGKPRWVEKTPGNAGVIGRILDYWPDARILHIVRDPRDVYVSLLENGKWTEPDAFADRWCATAGAALDWSAAAGGGHPAYHQFRYERLVREPADVTRDVLAFLGEPWEEAVAAFDGEPGDFERVRRATGKESTTLQRLAQPLTGARVGVWRKALGPAEWAPVRAELGRRGYGEAVDRLTEETDAWLASADSTAP